MNHRTVKYVKSAGECSRCKHCRSTMGEDAKLYCRVRPICKRRCEHFEGAFVDAFSIPAKNTKN